MTNQNKNKKKEYVSPIKDELKLPMLEIGEGVLVHQDKKNKRILLDIDYSTRRGVSSTGSTVKIATATYQVQGEEKMKMSMNMYSKDFSDEEYVEVAKVLDKKIKDKVLAEKRKVLKS